MLEILDDLNDYSEIKELVETRMFEGRCLEGFLVNSVRSLYVLCVKKYYPCFSV